MANKNAPPQPKKSSSTTRVLLLISLLGMIVFVGALAFVAYVITAEEKGDLDDDSWVVVKLSGAVPESPPPPSLFEDPSSVHPTVTELAAAIRAAASDDRVDGIYLRLESPAIGWGGLQELRTAIDVFREKGKPCVAYAEVLDDAGYYVGSGCNKVVLAPSGISMVNGMATSTTYYAGVFEKIGITAEFEHVGDFKSAVEPYERMEPSEPAAEAMNYLLDSIYSQLVEGISTGRGISVDTARELIDHAPLSPIEAKERGLVDVLAYPDAVVARLHEIEKEDWEDSLSKPISKELQEAAQDRLSSINEVVKDVRAANNGQSNRIAVLYADGPILSGESDGGLFGGQILADRTFRTWMREIRKDDSVKALVLRVNSPGGSGLASDMMWREIRLAQEEGLPVVVSMGNYAASGGYYISAPADWIVANPGTITGSIGVFGGKLNMVGVYEKLGLGMHSYKRGELSDLFSSTTAFSDQGRATYRRFLADFYEVFLSKVTEGREMDRDAAHSVAQGRVWTGTQALERRLVDELGGLDVALNKAAALASLEDGEWGPKTWPRKKDIFELLMEDFNKQSFSPTVEIDLGLSPLAQVADKELKEVLLLEAMLSDGPVALLPGALRIE